MEQESELIYLEEILLQIRSDHPKISLRDIYWMTSPLYVGRDKFERYFIKKGYQVLKVRSYIRTTNSRGTIRFPNLVSGKELTDINQVWVSDITYYQLSSKTYYLTFIMDLYSRRILGYSCSKTLKTIDTTMVSIKKAINLRKTSLEGLIFHSDGGGQYYSNKFTGLISRKGIQSSMGEIVYENAYAERLNGVIKNNYLNPYHPTNYKELKQALKKAVKMYNTQKPHSKLGRKSPVKFEQELGIKINKNKFNTFVKPISKPVNAIQA